MKFPVMFVNHGGGPMPLMGRQPQLAQHMQEAVKRYIPEKPTAIVVLSAHWEASPIQISNYDVPQPLLYDYGGFPSETYQYQYPARGSPDLSSRIHNLLKDQGIPSELENDRGFDHGVFVPLKIMFPDADIPVVAVSMDASLDSEKNMQIGQALAPLRDHGVFILGSGYTFHNLPNFFHPTTASKQAACNFNEWLKETMLSSQPSEMKQRLTHWEQAPGAKQSHPREEHLIPLLMTVAASDFTGAQVIYDTTRDADSEHAVTGYLFN
jgi:aromatic ring-opening dioxygenase catalytic subunit (LigB family)